MEIDGSTIIRTKSYLKDFLFVIHFQIKNTAAAYTAVLNYTKLSINRNKLLLFLQQVFQAGHCSY